MKKNRRYIHVILAMFDVAYSVDAGGTNWATNGGQGYVVNGYGNTIETSGNDFTPEKAVFYNRVFMKNHIGKLVHGQFGEKLTMPKHSGDVVNIRGLTPYPTATTPLTEGVTPQGNLMNFYYVEIAVNQYGKYTPITDFASFACRDDVLIHDAEELSSQSGRTIEEIDREALNAGLSVIYAPAVVNGTVNEVNSRIALGPNSKFTVDCVFRGANYLEVQNAEPIGDSYVAIIHPNCKYDVINDPKFISIVQYSAATRIFKGEIGMIGNVRFVVSTFAKVWKQAAGAGATHYDVYSTLVLGKDAYKTVEIEGEGMHTIIKPHGSGGTSDPLNQRATQGWKTTHGIGITGQTCMVRIESTATLNTETQNNWDLIAQARG